MLEGQRAEYRVVEVACAGDEAFDVVVVPAFSERLAGCLEWLDQRGVVGVADTRFVLGPEVGEEAAAVGVPVRRPLPARLLRAGASAWVAADGGHLTARSGRLARQTLRLPYELRESGQCGRCRPR